jgi:hypothetical protein
MNSQSKEAELPTELAHRAGDGIEVRLLWESGGGRLTVLVTDFRSGSCFELVAGNGSEALDAFYHPFAYAACRGLAHPLAAASSFR